MNICLRDIAADAQYPASVRRKHMQKQAALITIGEEDQIFPQLPDYERNAILCQPIYPSPETGEISPQELAAVKGICELASVSVFIVDSNNTADLTCMKSLADMYDQNEADFIVAACKFGNKQQGTTELLHYLCQKANGLYLIDNNYDYWNLVIYLCWGLRAFFIHTKSPDAKPEHFDNIRKIFPRRANQLLTIIDTDDSSCEPDGLLDKLLANETTVQKLNSAYAGYCLLTTTENTSPKHMLENLNVALAQCLEHVNSFLTVFQLGTDTDKNYMLTVIATKKVVIL
jgi:hypothetical protein